MLGRVWSTWRQSVCHRTPNKMYHIITMKLFCQLNVQRKWFNIAIYITNKILISGPNISSYSAAIYVSISSMSSGVSIIYLSMLSTTRLFPERKIRVHISDSTAHTRQNIWAKIPFSCPTSSVDPNNCVNTKILHTC